MLKFTHIAQEKVKYFLDHAKDSHLVLRIAPTETATFHFSLEPSESATAQDLTMPIHGFLVRMDSKTAVTLATSTVDWQTKDDKEGFTVIQPTFDSKDFAKFKNLEEQIIEVLKTIYDPEIPVNIYELGLIYHVDIEHAPKIKIQMTLTAPNCPAAEVLPDEVKRKVESLDGVESAQIDLTWEPAWNPDRMSEAAKLQMGM